jgi:hypothetical protein
MSTATTLGESVKDEVEDVSDRDSSAVLKEAAAVFSIED